MPQVPKPLAYLPRRDTDERITFAEGRAALYELTHLFDQEDMLTPIVVILLREIAVLVKVK